MRVSTDGRPMAVELEGVDHPTWVTAAATGVGYLLILVALFLVLFVVPWLLFGAL